VYRIFGYKPGEVEPSSKAFYAVAHPEDHAAIRHAVTRALRGGGDFASTHRIVRPSGDVRFVHEFARLVTDIDGRRPPRLVGTICDVTDEAKFEQRFRALLEAAPDAMVIVNAASRIEVVNTQAEKVFGYTRKQLIGQPFDLLIPERFRATHRRD
jgi:PAS domain S-box-containing protein